MRVGLATIQHGRGEHLAHQAAAVAAVSGLARYLVVSMDATPPPPGAEGLVLPAGDAHRLPLAQARNAAVRALDDCDLVILLDVDCLPHPDLALAMARAHHRAPARAALLGPVGWLAAPVTATGLGAASRGEAAMTVRRTFPERGIEREERAELFWSLAFAIAPALYAEVGGFDERYRGWGAEDTDFGRRLVAAGIELWKVADAWAFHQPHPRAHLDTAGVDAILANAERFHARWGDWPMPDVLGSLSARGLIDWTPESDRIDLS